MPTGNVYSRGGLGVPLPSREHTEGILVPRRSDIGAFAIVPESMIDSTLSDGAIRLWVVLARFANSHDVAWPSHASLAKRVGASEKSVKRRLAELEAFGYLRITSGKSAGESNKYTLIYSGGWVTHDLGVGHQCPTRVGHQCPTNDSQLEREPITILDWPKKLELHKWEEWVKHRKEMRKPLTPLSVKKQLAFLAKQPDPHACIDLAIMNGWQGLFAEKKAPAPPTWKQRREYMGDTNG